MIMLCRCNGSSGVVWRRGYKFHILQMYAGIIIHLLFGKNGKLGSNIYHAVLLNYYYLILHQNSIR